MFKNKFAFNFNVATQLTNESCKNALNKLEQTVKNVDLDTINENNIINVFEIDKQVSLLLLTIRKSIENFALFGKMSDKSEKRYMASLAEEKLIKIFVNDDILVVKTPYLFRKTFEKRDSYSNFLMADLVGVELQKWLNVNQKYSIFNRKLLSKNVHWTMILLRKTPKFSTNEICDNDNLEASKIINVITKSINQGDNASKMDLVIKYIQCSNPKLQGSYFCLLPTSKYERNPKIVYHI